MVPNWAHCGHSHPCLALSKYLTEGVRDSLYGRRSCCHQHPVWVGSGNFSPEAGTRLHLIKECTLLLRTICVVRWGSWMEEVLNPKKGVPSGEIVVIWGMEMVQPLFVSHTRVYFPLWIEDQLPWQPNPQQFSWRQSWHQKVGGSGEEVHPGG